MAIYDVMQHVHCDVATICVGTGMSAAAMILAGGAAGRMRGGRHIRLAQPTPLANLHLTLLDKVGVRLDSFADSRGKMDELFEPVQM